MKPEEKARLQIDHLLEAAGWQVQSLRNLNLGASLGVAVREFPLKIGGADYLLFVDRKMPALITTGLWECQIGAINKTACTAG